jgi:hypothetical protein
MVSKPVLEVGSHSVLAGPFPSLSARVELSALLFLLSTKLEHPLLARLKLTPLPGLLPLVRVHKL